MYVMEVIGKSCCRLLPSKRKQSRMQDLKSPHTQRQPTRIAQKKSGVSFQIQTVFKDGGRKGRVCVCLKRDVPFLAIFA